MTLYNVKKNNVRSTSQEYLFTCSTKYGLHVDTPVLNRWKQCFSYMYTYTIYVVTISACIAIVGSPNLFNYQECKTQMVCYMLYALSPTST